MDLKQLDTRAGAEAGFDLKLMHPATGLPLDIVIRIKGADSATYHDKLNALSQARLERNVRAGRVHSAVPSDEVEDDAIALLAACITGWSGLTEGGVDVDFNAKNAARILADYPWLREQVSAAVNNRAHFLPRSATAS